LFEDTNRRVKLAEAEGCFTSAPAFPGERKARAMDRASCPVAASPAWPHVKPIFQAIAAKVADGVPCCDWVGEHGAGHYVKMVHNGIEYGDMQLICEAYQVMRDGLGMTPDEMHQVFKTWNEGDLESYLVEITRDILDKKDEDGAPLVDKILDTAGQKGTGKWTVQNSADLGIPDHPDRRGGVFTLCERAEGRAREGGQAS
jgi:6-phosphogluconate dehydrogenase